MHALSAHVQVADDCPLSACDAVQAQVNALPARRYRITHTTIQFEYAFCERREPDDLYCRGMGGEDGGHEHAGHDHREHYHEQAKDGVHVHD